MLTRPISVRFKLTQKLRNTVLCRFNRGVAFTTDDSSVATGACTS